MGQTLKPQVACCRSEKDRQCELQLWELSDHPAAQSSLVRMQGCTMDPQDVFTGDPDEWACCRPENDRDEHGHGLSSMESLTYTPVRFDINPTLDVDRSHARYSKIVVHSSRARTQKRSKAWEEWLRAATAGRTVTLLVGAGFNSPSLATTDAFVGKCKKVQAMYHVDRGLTKLSIIPSDSEAAGDEDEKPAPPITILVNNIQVVCPLTDFMLLSDVMEEQLDESERARAALVQYLTQENESKRVCFLEESEVAKDRCIQALTALWLEKRNDHSMWF